MIQYETINVKKDNGKKNVIIVIIVLLIITIIFGAIYGGIKYSKYINEKNEKEQIELQEKQKQEEILKKEQEEKERLKNSKPLTEDQIVAIDKIYSSDEKRVFLTFDDGPTTSVTPFILDLLKQEEIKVTFFVLGNRAKANPELIQREFKEGHYIANHGYTHKYSEIYSNEQKVLDEYNYTESCIQEALSNPDYHSRVFRYPGGSNGGYYNKIKQQSKKLLRENNIAYLDWNCLSKDAEGANTKEDLIKNVIDTIENKKSLVILMHDSSDKILTYETLTDIIKYLRENGYVFKNLYDIL